MQTQQTRWYASPTFYHKGLQLHYHARTELDSECDTTMNEDKISLTNFVLFPIK